MNARQWAILPRSRTEALEILGIRKFSRLGTGTRIPILPASATIGESRFFTPRHATNSRGEPAQGYRRCVRGTLVKTSGGIEMQRRQSPCCWLFVAILVLLAPATTVTRAQATNPEASPAAAQPIKDLSKCLDPTQIQRWDRLDVQHYAVATVSDQHFEVQFAAGCDLGRDKPSAWQMSTQAPTRLCGFAGETAIDASGDLCTISAVKILDRKQFEGLLKGGG